MNGLKMDIRKCRRCGSRNTIISDDLIHIPEKLISEYRVLCRDCKHEIGLDPKTLAIRIINEGVTPVIAKISEEMQQEITERLVRHSENVKTEAIKKEALEIVFKHSNVRLVPMTWDCNDNITGWGLDFGYVGGISPITNEEASKIKVLLDARNDYIIGE